MRDRRLPEGPSLALYQPLTVAKPRTLKRLSGVVRLGMSVGLLGWLAWRTDWVQIAQALRHLRLELGLAAVGLYVLIQLVSSVRWQLLARPLGFHQSLGRFTSYYFIGMFFNLVLPTSVGGDVVRAWYLDGKSGQRLNAFLSVLVDRASGLMVLLMVACGGVLLVPLPLPAWVTASVWACAAGSVVGLAALPVALHWTSRFARVRRLAAGARTYLRYPGLVVGTAGLSLVVQSANVVLVWLVGLAMDAPVPGAYYWILVPMVSLLTLMPVSVNGMGIREGSTVLLLAPLGVSESTALCLAVLWFAVVSAASLVGGAVYLVGCFPRPEVQKDHESIGRDSGEGRTGQSPAAA
jgi:uncharacterized membrane protein YbhN (UPF0104 family)